MHFVREWQLSNATRPHRPGAASEQRRDLPGPVFRLSDGPKFTPRDDLRLMRARFGEAFCLSRALDDGLLPLRKVLHGLTSVCELFTQLLKRH